MVFPTALRSGEASVHASSGRATLGFGLVIFLLAGGTPLSGQDSLDLASPNSETRRAAWIDLAQSGEIAFLTSALEAGSEQARLEAARALKWVAFERRHEGVAGLALALEDAAPAVRLAAAATLSDYGPAARPALAAVASLACSQRPDDQAQGLLTLQRVDPAAIDHVPEGAFHAALASPDSRLRAIAAEAVAHLPGARKTGYQARLSDMAARDPSGLVRAAAGRTLGLAPPTKRGHPGPPVLVVVAGILGLGVSGLALFAWLRNSRGTVS